MIRELFFLGAHLFQQCNNFKDPGVQHYGQGQLFNSVRDEMDGIFCSLPAPKGANSNVTIDMSVFNDSERPCFHGSCTVKLLDGSLKFVKDIQRDDRLYPHGGKVDYVLRTFCNRGQAQMVLVRVFILITNRLFLNLARYRSYYHTMASYSFEWYQLGISLFIGFFTNQYCM